VQSELICLWSVLLGTSRSVTTAVPSNASSSCSSHSLPMFNAYPHKNGVHCFIRISHIGQSVSSVPTHSVMNIYWMKSLSTPLLFRLVKVCLQCHEYLLDEEPLQWVRFPLQTIRCTGCVSPLRLYRRQSPIFWSSWEGQDTRERNYGHQAARVPGLISVSKTPQVGGHSLKTGPALLRQAPAKILEGRMAEWLRLRASR
jgi:hypothetical protein